MPKTITMSLKPITKFQDLIAALKESNQAKIAERIITEFKVKCEEHNILTQVIKKIDHSYGQTLTEQIEEVRSQLRRLQKDKDEDIISYIEKFDKLSRAQMENLNTIVDLGSNQMDLEEQMKQTMRRTTI